MRRWFSSFFLVSCLVGASAWSASVALADVDPPPVVGAVRPLTASVGTAVQLEVDASDNFLINYCYLVIDGTPLPGNMTLVSGTATNGTWRQTYTFGVSGPHLTKAVCIDFAEGAGNGAETQINVTSAADTSFPVVGVISPDAATVSTPVTFSVSFSDDVGVTACDFSPATTYGAAAMTLTPGPGPSGTARYTYTYTPSMAGTVEARVQCIDGASHVVSVTRMITVSPSSSPPPADTTAPTIVSISSTPARVTVNQSTRYTVEYTDDRSGVTQCMFFADGGLVAALNADTPALRGSLYRDHVFSTTGDHTVRFSCKDVAGNERSSTMSVNVNPASSPTPDTTPPTLGAVTWNMNPPIVGSSVTFSVPYTDASEVRGCYLYVDNILAGGVEGAGLAVGTASRPYTFTGSGRHTVRFMCRDIFGNQTETIDYSLNVLATSLPVVDRTAPVVSVVSPLSVIVGSPVRLSLTVVDSESLINYCTLYVNGTAVGSLDLSGVTASRWYTFPYAGTYSLYGQCVDASGNLGVGSPVLIAASVFAPPPPPPSYGSAVAGNLMKLVCPPYAVASDHPCKAVYYFGRDGRRHAFPNARVYFTWYPDFSGVVDVSDAFLASIPLGRNVTYRPGLRLVKFTTLARVYAVGRGGVLRWIANEDIARRLYGYAWNMNVDDVPDVFYTNYTFGSDILAAEQFNPSTEANLAGTIDANW